MVTPISNDKILPSDNASGSVTGKKKADQGSTPQSSASSDAISKDENATETSSVDVGRANQIYNRSTSKLASGEDAITNPEQARAVAAEVRTQIEGNALQAFKAQTAASSSGLAALLEAAPV